MKIGGNSELIKKIFAKGPETQPGSFSRRTLCAPQSLRPAVFARRAAPRRAGKPTNTQQFRKSGAPAVDRKAERVILTSTIVIFQITPGAMP
jgi:hypothetical protein